MENSLNSNYQIKVNNANLAPNKDLGAINSASINQASLSQIQNDTLELSTKKETGNKKKAFIIGGAVVSTALATIGLLKLNKTSKFKKLIMEEYDKIAKEAQESMQKSGLKFEKPKLVFKKNDAFEMAAYIPQENIIEVNSKYLSPKKLVALKDIRTHNVSEDLVQYRNIYPLDFVKKSIKSGDRRQLTQAEFMMDKIKTLTHETQHAKQFQEALHAEGAMDVIVQSFKKQFPDITDETMKESAPFLFSFKPDKLIPMDAKIINPDNPINKKFIIKNKDKIDFNKIIMKDDKYYFASTPKDLLESFLNVGDNDSHLKYITNLIEVDARGAEFLRAQKGFEGVDDEMNKAVKTLTQLNYQNLLEKALLK